MAFEKRAVDFKEMMFKDGEPFSGVYFEYYENGLDKYGCSYRDGLKHGSEWMYNEHAMITEVRTYKKGEMRTFEENQNILYYGLNKDDKRYGEWQFYKNGKLEKYVMYKNGEIVGKEKVEY